MRLVLTQVAINFYSKIVQEDDSEEFSQELTGKLEQTGAVTRIAYTEADGAQVKLLLTPAKLIISRQQGTSSSLLRLAPGEKLPCQVTAAGRKMELSSQTSRLDFTDAKLEVEYQLFSGLYLVGNYTVRLLFD
ncbi:MAG: DUF1934 family protein [Lactobacillus sp.]|jgi:uncharacterized beta-barrel protein YwiB (DUF1934 family)|nr:DUF1934 family protein [Lactobacillus sp.]MCH3905826.1 DUF1934 family protein [Lactobacillus sp.]MCH3990592.1 DUF1934 family protein [Lactobacillus sp.]MCH4068693.1 DUF1934 family protein [Lactobacillus sp.]MCI1303822.1 DUF1934 family protein [Lactobacillus sp.]